MYHNCRAPADGKLVGIIDLKDYGFKNLDSRGFIAGFDILQVSAVSPSPQCS
jgi:hypothetical protein